MADRNILVLCTGNSCRSQMAEGWLRKFGGDRFQIFSAGVEAHGLNPRAVAVMGEAGVDISSHTSNLVDDYLEKDFELVITVCDHAKEVCPVLPGAKKTVHHSFEDPAKATGSEEEILNAFRRVRDEIRSYSESLISDS